MIPEGISLRSGATLVLLFSHPPRYQGWFRPRRRHHCHPRIRRSRLSHPSHCCHPRLLNPHRHHRNLQGDAGGYGGSETSKPKDTVTQLGASHSDRWVGSLYSVVSSFHFSFLEVTASLPDSGTLLAG